MSIHKQDAASAAQAQQQLDALLQDFQSFVQNRPSAQEISVSGQATGVYDPYKQTPEQKKKEEEKERQQGGYPYGY